MPIKKPESKAAAKPTKVSAKSAKTADKPETRVASQPPAVNQTTDAAALAAIDTSGYVLPSVKVPGRRGRKPKEFQPENDEVAALNAVERAELKAVDKAKAKDRKAKEKALLKDAFSSDTEATEEELERRRQKLKTLIKFGKERGFLTYAEINDHLPDNIVDPEAIEGIIGTFNDMGIAVYEHAPDAETLLLSDNVATVTSDDEAEAAAEAALLREHADRRCPAGLVERGLESRIGDLCESSPGRARQLDLGDDLDAIRRGQERQRVLGGGARERFSFEGGQRARQGATLSVCDSAGRQVGEHH